MTIQVVKKYLKDFISISVINFKKLKNAYVDLINIYKPLFFCYILIIFQYFKNH